MWGGGRWPKKCERCDFLTLVSHFLLVFNSSCNIVIYCWKDEKFRKVGSNFVLTFFSVFLIFRCCLAC